MTNAWPRFTDYALYGELHCFHCGEPLQIGGERTTHYYEHANGRIECTPKKADDQ